MMTVLSSFVSGADHKQKYHQITKKSTMLTKTDRRTYEVEDETMVFAMIISVIEVRALPVSFMQPTLLFPLLVCLGTFLCDLHLKQRTIEQSS